MKESKLHIPTVLVVLGATGDLMHKKIVPALFHLYEKEKLPRLFHAVGFSRRTWNNETFQNEIRDIVVGHEEEQTIDATAIMAFTKLWSYHRGDFNEQSGYISLARELGYFDDEWKVCSNKLFYIAAPPQNYEEILNNLHESKLTLPCSPEEGFTRVLIEKPFGRDQVTAERLETVLSRLFKEEQIYRIDHYLAKEMLQNILNFRFSNTLFEGSWSREFIESVTIRLWESIGVEKRGSFYDGVGALRDVGQNHILQMLALIAMEHPGSFSSERIRDKRAQILRSLVVPSQKEVENFSYRAQYNGYKQISGVNPTSVTETYFKIRAFLSDKNWRGVPFILESGKRMPKALKEIIVTFRHPTPCLCPPGSGHELKNRVTFQIEPDEGVFVDLWSKKPGLNFEMTGGKFEFLIRTDRRKRQYVEEYEKLLLDSILGDQTLFVRSDEVSTMWKFIDPVSEAWSRDKVSLRFYQPGSIDPVVKSELIDQSVFKIGEMRSIKKEVAIVGLGKMGGNIAGRLIEKGWKVVGFNRTPEVTKKFELVGLIGAYSIADLKNKLTSARVILLSLPAGPAIDEVLFGTGSLETELKTGDIIVDIGNSFYKDSIRRAARLAKKGVHFVDVGVSGGPGGAIHGASLMIGGSHKLFEKLEPLYAALSQRNGYQFFEGIGAGHFVKMVHNGIEYGMMQAIAEGFTVLKKSSYRLNLVRVADVYNHGSVIESRLIEWLQKAFELHGSDLIGVTSTVAHTGEGDWTVKQAKEMQIETKIIEGALNFRILSEKNPSYTGKILSALREQFGGHKIC